jgi:hypothetical protein
MNREDITFVITACAKDVHYAKALMGSIAHFYPDHAIRVIVDTDIAERDIEQMRMFPNTSVLRVIDLVTKHKHCLTKLLAQFNALFMEDLASVLVLDADCVMVAPILKQLDRKRIFTALSGRFIDWEDPEERASFTRWAYDVKSVESFGFELSSPPKVYIQSCAYYVDIKRFPIDAFLRALPVMNRTHEQTQGPFQAGDQGFLNWLANNFLKTSFNCCRWFSMLAVRLTLRNWMIFTMWRMFRKSHMDLYILWDASADIIFVTMNMGQYLTGRQDNTTNGSMVHHKFLMRCFGLLPLEDAHVGRAYNGWYPVLASVQEVLANHDDSQCFSKAS